MSDNPYRTHTCNELRASHVGDVVRLSGWIHNKRDHGGLIFIDLRDRKGLTQMAKGGRKWLGWIETFTKPRLKGITRKRSERIIGGFLCLFSASILVPLPMTNTVPGFGVALASFGLINKDGVLVILGLLLGFAWIFGLVVLGPVALLALIGAAKDAIMGFTA